MTTGRQDASFASGLRQEAPSPTKTRWVILALLALAGLTLLAYFQPLPVLLLVVGVVVVALTWARPFWVFGGLLALLPFHEQMLRVVTWQLGWTGVRVTALSLWKEAVIGLLLGVLIVQHVIGKRRIQAKLYQFDLWLLALVLFSGIYIAVAATPSIGVFGFRNYFEPLAVFFLARLLPYSRKELKRLLIVLSVIAAGVAAFGIYQALAIDFPTMIRMGYVDDFGNLPFAFKTALADGQPRPRAISTVTGPNQLAMYLNLFILLAGYAATKAWPFTQLVQGRTARPLADCAGRADCPVLGLPVIDLQPRRPAGAGRVFGCCCWHCGLRARDQAYLARANKQPLAVDRTWRLC